ncbi:acyl carrier protein [Halomonas denitrificans]|uniref:acyl carrier protein n=1 Tax=Halomonas TaxID=2745 RepID=UPI001A8EB94C|nr:MULTISPECIES: acyl carrier protein [Halomonas]MBN8413925.1 acyl carrier protein [Halomonas litopenaei]MED5294232.1 acyl carrier protein [Pseudomonadota bacterium]MBY5926873.1 acyl carrier protein [Halomonas sp. DP4Y7-2]MBY5970180.1 acyl carrier protein [Halomonas denitrificans]MBY5985933.1 acyl carrier protein [Halomonas sp. DP5Y7-2]
MSTEATVSREQILAHVQRTLVELFEVSPAEVSPEARLYEDLDIDSIDAVDLVVELKQFTGRRIDPEAFKSVRSIDDVVNAVDQLMRG